MVAHWNGWEICWLTVVVLVQFSAANKPPQFITDWQTEIIVRLKEGPETPAGKYKLIIYLTNYKKIIFFNFNFYFQEVSYIGFVVLIPMAIN